MWRPLLSSWIACVLDPAPSPQEKSEKGFMRGGEVCTQATPGLRSLRGRRKKRRGRGERKVRKRGKGNLTLSPQSPSFFLPPYPLFPYPFRRLLRRLGLRASGTLLAEPLDFGVLQEHSA